MNSSELAQIADVTVRTLRHYHQVGVLDEPPRSANGYRKYSTDDLVRVLQIKRLSSLGFSLKQMKPVLNNLSSETEVETALDLLDKELAAQIGRLEAQREVIATIRNQKLSPDTPLDLVDFFGKYKEIGVSDKLEKTDKAAMLILESMLRDEQTAELSKALNDLSKPSHELVFSQLYKDFDSLSNDSTDEAIDQCSAQLLAYLEDTGLKPASDVSPMLESSFIERVLESYIQPQYNSAQQKVMQKVLAHLNGQEVCL